MKFHIVRNKETVKDITFIYSLSIDELKENNRHIRDWDRLIPGTKLKIPVITEVIDRDVLDMEPFVEDYYPKKNIIDINTPNTNETNISKEINISEEISNENEETNNTNVNNNKVDDTLKSTNQNRNDNNIINNEENEKKDNNNQSKKSTYKPRIYYYPYYYLNPYTGQYNVYYYPVYY